MSDPRPSIRPTSLAWIVACALVCAAALWTLLQVLDARGTDVFALQWLEVPWTLPTGLLLVALGLRGEGAGGATAVLAGAFALGITYGAVQNLTLVIALARAGEGRTATVSAVWNACYDSGTAIGALVVGLVAAQVGLPGTYVLVAVLLAVVLPLAVTLPRALRSVS